MSIECSECERDLRSGHDPSCSQSLQAEIERLREAENARLTAALSERQSEHDSFALNYAHAMEIERAEWRQERERLTADAAQMRIAIQHGHWRTDEGRKIRDAALATNSGAALLAERDALRARLAELEAALRGLTIEHRGKLWAKANPDEADLDRAQKALTPSNRELDRLTKIITDTGMTAREFAAALNGPEGDEAAAALERKAGASTIAVKGENDGI